MLGPFQYTGNKHRSLDLLLDAIPESTQTLFEVFGGSGVLGLNALYSNKVKTYRYNEFNPYVCNMFNVLTHNKSFVDDVLALEQFLVYKDDKEKFYVLRTLFNACKDSYKQAVILYSLIAKSFSNDVRFNDQGEFNMPFGDRNSLRCDVLREINRKTVNDKILVSCGSYVDVLDECTENDFVFLDPPYFNTTATYNGCWNEENEKDLYKRLDTLTKRNVKWALTNTLVNKDVENKFMSEWLQNSSNIYTLDTNENFSNSSFRKNKSKTVELLVTNFKFQQNNLEIFL